MDSERLTYSLRKLVPHRYLRLSIRLPAVFLLTGYFLLFLIASAQAQRTDPRLEWRELNTSRFRVIFPASLRTFAQRTARIAEDLLPAIESFLESRLPYRPVIVLKDHSDFAGGYADPLFGEIHFVVAEPSDLTFGHRYDSWIKLILTHELIHLVHLGAVGPDLAKARQLLGYVVLPNLIQPIWIWEGYAMYGESQFGGGERVANPMYQMYLRDMALRDDFIPRHLLSGYSYLDEWPGRMGVYLYGSSAVRYMAEHYGEDVLTALSRERSRSLDPVGFGRIFRNVLGKTVDEVWQEWQESLRHSAEQTARRVEREPLTSYRVLGGKGFYSRNPGLSPDGESLVYTLAHPHYLPGIRVVYLRSGEEQLLVRGSIGSRPVFSPDGRSLVYAKAAPDLFTHWYDLYRYDMESGREYRLTYNERAFSPAFQRDAILYLRRNQVPETLVKRVLDSGKTRVLHEFPIDFRPLHLVAHPVNPVVAVSGRWQGQLVLVLIDLDTGGLERILPMTAPDPMPSFSPDGRFLVFSDARDGIFNVYAYDLDKKTIYRLTNLLGGAFEPVMTGDGIYASFYGADGYRIGRIPLDRVFWQEVFWPEREFSEDTVSPGGLAEEVWYPESAYRSFSALGPRYWAPSGEGITLTGRDPLGFHAYSLGVEFLSDPLGGFFNYRGGFMVPEVSFTLRYEAERVEWEAGLVFPLEAGEWGRGSLGLGFQRVWREDDLSGGFWTGVVLSGEWSRSVGDDRWISHQRWNTTGRWGQREGYPERDLVFSWRGNWQRAGATRPGWDGEVALGFSNQQDYYTLGGRGRFWGIAGYPEDVLRGALAGRARVAFTFPLATLDQPLLELGVVKDLTGTLYVEGGMAGNDWADLETRFTVGGEITLYSYLAEEFPVNLTIGTAFPLDRDLVAEWYLEVGILVR